MTERTTDLVREYWPQVVMFLIGFLSVLLGGMVLAGWHTENIRLIQVFPAFVPMQYNTALGFLLSGFALMAVSLGRLRFGVILGALVSVVGLLTLAEYLFNLQLGIDELFMKHYITVETVSPGRMAPNTALCFSLFGLALFALSMKKTFIAGILATVIMALGSVAFLGYVANVESAYGWGNMTRMAVHTSLGFILVGAGLFSAALKGKEKIHEKGSRLSVYVFMGVLTVTVCLWQALVAREYQYIHTLMNQESLKIKQQMQQAAKERILALQRMGQRWELRQGTPVKEWTHDAQAHVEGLPGFEAIAWIDPSFYVRWIVPLQGNEHIQSIDFAFEPKRKEALERARDQQQVAILSSIDLIKGGKGFFVIVPLVMEKKAAGFILGSINIQKFIEAVLDEDILNHYALVVFDGQEVIYSQWINQPYDEKLGREFECPLVSWRVRLWPLPAVLEQIKTSLPWFALAIGLLLAFLLMLVLCLRQTAQVRTEEAERINQEKEEEIGKRKSVEEELRRFTESLETRIDDRTKELKSSQAEALNMMEEAEEARRFAEQANVGLKKEMDERMKIEQQLVQAQKMEGIGRLAGGVAHDFNNQLSAIIGYSELLLESMGPEEPKRREVEEILKAALRSANLTKQLLAFSRQQLIVPKNVDVNALILNMESMLRRLISENIDFIFLPNETAQMIKIDSAQFENILVNLALNARDAMPEGGKLIIKTQNVVMDNTFFGSEINVKSGNYALISVSDTGSGMSKKIQDRIFEPFFTTKEEGKGTGLGLATCYGIVKQNNGYIHVYSKPGKGSIFNVYFPLVEEKEAPAARPAEKKESLCGYETVLVVEDEKSVREMTTSILKKYGYTILEASNGEEALRMLKKQGREVALLLTDMVMPQMGGKELAEAVRPLYPKIKILFTSGYAGNSMIEQGVMKEGIDFIQKPFTIASLTSKVREALDRKE